MIDKVAIVGAFVVTATLKTEVDKTWSLLQGTLGFIQGNAWWLILVIMGVGAAARIVVGVVGDEWAWRKIQKLVDDLQQEAFLTANPPHEHRVTLFRRSVFRPWYWVANFRRFRKRTPWAGWVHPVLRSCHTAKKTNAFFLAPDDAGNAEGIAGHAWAQNTVVEVDDLPDLGDRYTVAELKRYCGATHVDADFMKRRVKNGKKVARSYAAVPVERFQKRWGVLVLDSTHPKGIKRDAELGLQKFAIMIGAILERA